MVENIVPTQDCVEVTFHLLLFKPLVVILCQADPVTWFHSWHSSAGSGGLWFFGEKLRSGQLISQKFFEV